MPFFPLRTFESNTFESAGKIAKLKEPQRAKNAGAPCHSNQTWSIKSIVLLLTELLLFMKPPAGCCRDYSKLAKN